MQEAVDAVEVDERTEVGDVFDRAGDLRTDVDFAEESLGFSERSCSMISRRLRTTFLRSSLILTILKS